MKINTKDWLDEYPLNKGDLAMMYSPHVCRKSALRLLNSYIHRAKGLLPALEDTGYSRAARHFTPRQLALVLEYLGEPYGE
ncbi:MAG: DUF4248 domain-containing protein [Bacteroidaceae bacterium]|nr:DUF4248 domain-containing protein [Bacteroidaceae bacterium]